MLKEAPVLRTFSNRFERKYVVDIKTYKKLVKSIEPFVKRDEYSAPYGKYRVLSVYYDSDDYKAFTEKIDGEKKRAKLRLRVYQPFGKNKVPNDKVFLEIKKKNDQTVFKERITLPLNDALRFIKDPRFLKDLFNGRNEKEVRALAETALIKELYRVKPKILVHYIREPFISRYNISLRITFDTCLKYRTNDLRLETKPTDKYFLSPHLRILELKYSTRLPIWIIDIFQKHECNLQTYSKYCNGLITQFEDNGVIF